MHVSGGIPTNGGECGHDGETAGGQVSTYIIFVVGHGGQSDRLVIVKEKAVVSTTRVCRRCTEMRNVLVVQGKIDGGGSGDKGSRAVDSRRQSTSVNAKPKDRQTASQSHTKAKAQGSV